MIYPVEAIQTERGITMAVNNVNPSSDALLQQSVSPRRETQATESAERPVAPPRTERAEIRQPEADKEPRPVVNTQGQTTGTRINTTA